VIITPSTRLPTALVGASAVTGVIVIGVSYWPCGATVSVNVVPSAAVVVTVPPSIPTIVVTAWVGSSVGVTVGIAGTARTVTLPTAEHPSRLGLAALQASSR
jgi:hypothetical protein